MSTFSSHEKGCTPLNPCKKCEAMVFLRSKLTEENVTIFLELLEFLELLQEDTPSLDAPIHILGLNARTLNALTSDHLTTLEKILKKTPGELLRIPNFGEASLKNLSEALRLIGREIGEFAE